MAYYGTNVPFAWCYGTMRSSTSISRSRGLSSLTDEGFGQFRANFSPTVSTSNYAMVGSASNNNGEAQYLCVRNSGTRSTSALSMEVYTYAGGRNDCEFGFALYI